MNTDLLQTLGWLWIPLFWLAASSLVVLVAMVRGLPPGRWLVAAFLLAPLALIACFVSRRWLLPLGLAFEEPGRCGPPLQIPPEKLLAGKAFRGEVKQLRQSGKLAEAADLLEVLIDVAEETAQRSASDVPYWYYEELARIRRSQKDSKRERRVLERYLARTNGSNPKVSTRLEKRLGRL